MNSLSERSDLFNQSLDSCNPAPVAFRSKLLIKLFVPPVMTLSTPQPQETIMTIDLVRYMTPLFQAFHLCHGMIQEVRKLSGNWKQLPPAFTIKCFVHSEKMVKQWLLV